MSKFTMAHAVAIVGVWLAPAAVTFALRANTGAACLVACVGFVCALLATTSIAGTKEDTAQGDAAEEAE